MNYLIRVNKLQSIIKRIDLDAVLITNPFNIFYLTGFKGVSETEREATALVDRSGLSLFAPRLYQSEVEIISNKNGLQVFVIEERGDLLKKPAKTISKVKALGIESDNLKVSELNEVKLYTESEIKETENLVENLREIKEQDEIKIMKMAVKITDVAFNLIKKEIKVGLTEKQIAKRMIEIMEKLGADGQAFDPIVASGTNSSLPHYITSDKKIEKGILLIDAGAKYKGYNGDLTRTYYIGEPDKKFVKTYNLVLTAQKTALSSIKEGVEQQNSWRVANQIFGKESNRFLHGLGHGIGLEVHEEPYLRKGRKNLLKEGMAITIEPGLYYPNWGGIRIEDYGLVGKDGFKLLSQSPRSLEDIVIV